MNDFAVFILTHGRPGKVSTYQSLIRCGYTGAIYLLVDNEDKTLEEYRARFGDSVIVFDKKAIAETFDEAGVFPDRRAVVYACNASFQVARDLGLKYFLQLDDDYSGFDYRFTEEYRYTQKPIRALDDVFAALLDYFISIPALTLCIGQSGDYIGGKFAQTVRSVRTKRKAMNTFFCAVDRPFQFVGRINEDVNTYVSHGNRGGLFLSVFQVSITQGGTQQNEGGMTELYLNSGTYVKSFYTVMFAPSCTVVRPMGAIYSRLHHAIQWNRAVPVILAQQWKRSNERKVRAKNGGETEEPGHD